MNENPEGTPNPLNPNPFDTDSPKTNPVTTSPRNVNPSEPVAEVSEVTVTETEVSASPLAPEERPMIQAAPAAEPKKHKKTGLIIGMVLCLFVAVGCGVAAALMLMNSDKDPVSAAMKKLMSGDGPANVVIDGDIEFVVNDSTSEVSKINLDLNAETKSNSLVNSAEANVVLTLRSGGELRFGFNEVYTESGDLYFKLDGVSSLFGQLIPEGSIDNMAMFGGVVEVLDGEWLKVSMDDLTELSQNTTMDSNLSCMIDLVDDINTSSNSAAELYNKNPFLSSTTENITINSKRNPVHQIVIDDEKFAEFVNSIQNSELTSQLYSCLGFYGNVSVSADDVAKIVKQLPAVFVEVDKDNNFSRLYMSYAAEDNAATVTIDLSFNYPSSINISEPNEYTTFEQVIQTIFMSMYDLENDMMIDESMIQTN